MTEIPIRRSAKLVRIKGSVAVLDRGTVDLLIEGDDKIDYGVEFDLPIVPAVITALSGHANELLANQGQPVSQAMNVVDLGLSMNPTGDTSLMLTLEGNLKLHLNVPREHSPRLRSLLSDLKELLDRQLQ